MALKAYGEDEVQVWLRHDLLGWTLENNWLRRRYKTDGWQTTMQLVNAIGYVAEAANHHPDLVVTWGQVELRVQTHTERAITDKDLEFARQIDAAVLWRPSHEGALGGGTRRAWVVAEPL